MAQAGREIIRGAVSILESQLLAYRSTLTEIAVAHRPAEITVKFKRGIQSCPYLPTVVETIIRHDRNGEKRRVVVGLHKSRPVAGHPTAVINNLRAVVLHRRTRYHTFLFKLQPGRDSPFPFAAQPFRHGPLQHAVEFRTVAVDIPDFHRERKRRCPADVHTGFYLILPSVAV